MLPSKRPGLLRSMTAKGPPPPETATAKYLAEAFMYCCSPVVVARRKPVLEEGVGEGREVVRIGHCIDNAVIDNGEIR